MQQNFNSSAQIGSLIVSAFSLFFSVLALYISRKSWQQSNRPIITARVTSAEPGGEKGTPLNIVVENTGNRPAINIRLSVPLNILESHLADNQVTEQKYKTQITRIFSERGVISVLGNGKHITNSFGFLSGGNIDSAWKDEARMEISIYYEDLDGRKFTHRNPLFIAGDEGFASTSWN